MYCATGQVRDRLSPGGNASGMASDALTDEQIEQAVAKGDATIDACLLARYTIPADGTWTPPSPEDADEITGLAIEPVQQWSVSLGTYFATLSYRRGLDLTADDPVRLEYTHTMGLLIAIRDGKGSAQLPPVGGGDAGAGSDATVVNLYDGVLWDAQRLLQPDLPRWVNDGRPW